jgi:hypothetical protein
MAAKTAAAPKTPKLTASPKPRGKSELYKLLSDHTNIPRKDVATLFETLFKVMTVDLAKPAANKPRFFVVPGMMKISAIYKPATKSATKPNPFKPGEMMETKAKPARTVIKVRPLKALKSAV